MLGTVKKSLMAASSRGCGGEAISKVAAISAGMAWTTTWISGDTRTRYPGPASAALAAGSLS